MTSSTGESIGIKEDSGGNCVSLSAIDPSTIADTTNRPENLIYGLIDMQIRTDTVGGTVTLTFYLPSPAPDGYKWYKYGPNKGWYDYSDHAAFDDATDQVTLTLIDGGAGDDDGVANGTILDPSGLGSSPFTPPAISGGGSGGGCFIATAAYGSPMEPHVKVLRQFRDRFLLNNTVGMSFVDLYCTYSPSLAEIIANHDTLRAMVRCGLLPVVVMSWMTLNLGPIATSVFILLFLSLISADNVVLFRKRRLR